MKRIALLCGVSVVACGGSAPAPAPAPAPVVSDPAPTPPKAEGPQIVMKQAKGAPTDCAASPPEKGLLDRSSTSFKRIEVTANAQHIQEKGWLAAGDVIVTASVGGCSHYGSSYIVDMPAKAGADKKTLLFAALGVLSELKLNDGSDNYRAEITSEIEGAKDDPPRLKKCDFPRGEQDRVMCNVEAPANGRVHVVLAYDIVL